MTRRPTSESDLGKPLRRCHVVRSTSRTGTQNSKLLEVHLPKPTLLLWGCERASHPQLCHSAIQGHQGGKEQLESENQRTVKRFPLLQCGPLIIIVLRRHACSQILPNARPLPAFLQLDTKTCTPELRPASE